MVEPLDIRAGLSDPSILGTPAPEIKAPEVQVEPQKPIETQPAQTVVPPVVETKTEVPPTVIPAEETGLKLDSLNRWLEANNTGLHVDSEDELKQIISSLSDVEGLKQKVAEYDSKLPYIEELENEFQGLINERDPVNVFGSPEAYHAHLVAQKLMQGRNIDDPRFISIIQSVARTDFSKMDDLDVVALGWQYDSPKFAGREYEIKKAILADIGVDHETLNDPEFKITEFQPTPEQELKLSRMRKAEVDRFEAVKSSVSVPDKKDWKSIVQEKVEQRQKNIQATQARYEQLQTGWSADAKRAAETLKTVEVTVPGENGQRVKEFEFEVDAEFKKLIPDMVTGFALQHNLDPTPENAEKVMDLVKGVYLLKNQERMFMAYRKELESKLREQQGKEQHNGRPINTGGPPPDRSKLTDADLVNMVVENLVTKR